MIPKGTLIRNRIPSYAAGFLLGLLAVMVLMQVKKAFMPEFSEVPLSGTDIRITAGGTLRFNFGSEPGKNLAYGFPSQMILAYEQSDGKFRPVQRFEYKHLVDEALALSPLQEPGKYQLRAQLFVCAFPGEKFCAKILLSRNIMAFSGVEAPSEVTIAVPLSEIAQKASKVRPN